MFPVCTPVQRFMFYLLVTSSTSSCYDGAVRLGNSTYDYTSSGYMYGGRVEVCYNGTFHPVCDEGWTDDDSVVVCNNVGFYSYSE